MKQLPPLMDLRNKDNAGCILNPPMRTYRAKFVSL